MRSSEGEHDARCDFGLRRGAGCRRRQATAAKGTRFWNLTHAEIDSLQLAPAGSADFGENLCLQDDDKSVEADERLQVTGIKSGSYDAKIHDVTGRSCSAKNITVEEGKVFSISEKELIDCKQ